MPPRLSPLRHLTRFRPHTRPSSTQAPQSRITRLEQRLPSFLRRYTTPLRTAPLSHITAFLLLHELTAILPLFGLTATFHYFNWLPPFFSEGKWVSEGVEKFGGWMRKKGWVDAESVEKGEEGAGAREGGRSGKWWGRGEKGVRLVVEVATAYAVTKALLPLRLALSVWGTPWFARWTVLPVMGLFGRGPKGAGVGAGVVGRSPAAGTNAVGGGVVKTSVK